MIRVLDHAEIQLISGGMQNNPDSSYINDLVNDTFFSNWDFGTPDMNDYSGGYDENEIIVTSPFTRDQISSMEQEAVYMAAVDLHTINTGVAGAGYVAGLGLVGSMGVGLLTSVATDQASKDIVTQKFEYIYNRQLAIGHNGGSYGDGYPALEIN